MTKPVILTGLRANNDLHLGNYLGALLPIVQMQKKYAGEYQINLFVPDLHSFTTPIDHSKLFEQTLHNLKLFVAAGLDLDDQNTFLYRQSRVPAHSELSVILQNFVGFGILLRLPQFKERMQKYGPEVLTVAAKNTGLPYLPNPNLTVGTFTYPVLMAADILLYNAKYVPVGDDQKQHIDLTRDIADRLNKKLKKDILIPPVSFEEQSKLNFGNTRLRIRDLLKPEKKMSKSDESGKGVIFLGDTPEAATKKVMSAATDSLGKIRYNKETQPGISNLIDILAALTDKTSQEIASQYEGQEQYGPLKTATAEAVSTFLNDFQSRLAQVDEAKLMTKLEASEQAMNQVANQTLNKVQKAVGLTK